MQIVHKAFEHPKAIMHAENHTNPQARLALLDQIAAATTDFAFRLQIADTKQFVLDAASSRN